MCHSKSIATWLPQEILVLKYGWLWYLCFLSSYAGALQVGLCAISPFQLSSGSSPVLSLYRHLQKHLCFQSSGILAQSLDWIGYHRHELQLMLLMLQKSGEKKPVEVGSLSHYSQGLLHLRCLAGFLPSRDINFHHLIVNSQQTGAQFEPFWASHGEDLPPFLTRSHQNCPNHRSREAVQLWSLLHQVAKLLSNPWKRIWCNELNILNVLKINFESLGVEIQVQTSFFPPAMARHGVANVFAYDSVLQDWRNFADINLLSFGCPSW